MMKKVLCLLCAVATFVAGDKWGRRLTIGLLSVSIVLQSCVLWFCASNNTSYAYMMGHYPAPWGNEIAAGIIEPLIALLFSHFLFFTSSSTPIPSTLTTRSNRSSKGPDILL